MAYQKPIIAFLFLAFSIMGISTTSAQEDDGGEIGNGIVLPDDNDKPVLVFDFVGGFRMAPPAGFKEEPNLQVFADGTVKCGANSPNLANAVGKISKKELSELLDFVVNQHRLFEITSNGVKQEIEKSGQRIMIADAPSSRFTINLKDRNHSCEVYAVGFIANQFKQIKDLQDLSAIQKRCQKLIGKTQLGPPDRRAEILKLLNKALKEQSPKSDPLTVDDLVFATTYANGKFSAAFGKNEMNKDGKPVRRINARFTVISKEAQPQISINIAPLASAG